MATLPTLKRKKQKMWTGGSLIKISLETCLTRENFSGYLGKLISNKSMNHTTVNNRKAYTCRNMKLTMMIVITMMIVLVTMALSIMMYILIF